MFTGFDIKLVLMCGNLIWGNTEHVVYSVAKS